MRVTTGIICEYNPMHSGHAYQLRSAREAGADCVIALMSGSFTERGELAVADKYTRAEIALLVGADLVLELPYPYSAGGAEYFATAGVSILDRLHTDTLCFGSESGDPSLLERAAEIALSDEFRAVFAEAGRSGKGSAAAYFNLLGEFLGIPKFGSNDVLGVEYLKAIRSLGSEMKPFILKREGASYHEEVLSAENIHPSATAIRAAFFHAIKESGDGAVAEAYARASGLDAAATEPFLRAVKANTVPVCFENAPAAILSFYRMHDPRDFSGIAEMHGGLAERICHAANNAATLPEFYRLASTKKYTDSRVRRAVLYGLTGVTEEDLRRPPAYVNLLGANEVGRAFLADYRKRKDATLRIVTRPAAILEDCGDADFARESALQRRAEALYTLFLPEKKSAGIYLRTRAVML